MQCHTLFYKIYIKYFWSTTLGQCALRTSRVFKELWLFNMKILSRFFFKKKILLLHIHKCIYILPQGFQASSYLSLKYLYVRKFHIHRLHWVISFAVRRLKDEKSTYCLFFFLCTVLKSPRHSAVLKLTSFYSSSLPSILNYKKKHIFFNLFVLSMTHTKRYKVLSNFVKFIERVCYS